MEKPKGVDPLEQRLIRVANRTRKPRRGTRILETQTPPNIEINPERVNPEVLFVTLVEGVERITTVPNPKAAEMLRANTSLMADRLVDSLWGNHEAFNFVSDSMAYLETEKPQLFDAVRRKLEQAKERGIKRDQLRRRFRSQMKS